MDYKAKYKEAFERAKMSYHTGSYDRDTLEMLEIIFPELKKSEDEKIRKSLISYLHGLGEFDYPDKKTYNNWLEWLEKQGEHAKFRDSIQVGDKVTRNQDGMLVNLSQLNRVAKPSKRQGGQKPAAWSEEDENKMGTIINVYHPSHNITSWLKSIKQRIKG